MPKTLKRKPIKATKGFQFDPIEHVYTLDSKPLHGVTSVLKVINKPALIQWAVNMADEHIRTNISYAIPGEDGGYWAIKPSVIAEAKVAHRKKKEVAGEAGTDVHAQIEALIKNWIEWNEGYAKCEYPEHTQVNAFVDWAYKNNVKFLASEQKLYSEHYWIAGTADFICDIDGKRYVGDVKTSSAIYPEYFIQCSAYAWMATEMGLFKDKGCDGVLIVNVPKRGGLNVKENYDLKGNFEAFKAALTIHKYLSLHN